MAEKVTEMRLKVDLQCDKCHKKVKKLLCKFPQIRDQVYEKKNNIVTIKVVCRNPEKFRDKLCCKGCGCITSIEIVEPPPPPPPRLLPSPPPPPPTVVVCPPVVVPIGVCCVSCYAGRPGGPCCHCYGGPPPCYVIRCDEYFCEDNTSSCTIM